MFGLQFPPCGSIKIFHIRDDTQNHPAASSWLHGKKQDHKRWRYITVDHSTIDVIDWINQTGRRVVSVLFCMAALASVWSVLDPWSLIKIHQERKIDEIDLYTVLVVVCKCCAKFFILSDRRWLWPFEGWIRSHHNFPISTKCQENWLLMDSLCLYKGGNIPIYGRPQARLIYGIC